MPAEEHLTHRQNRESGGKVAGVAKEDTENRQTI